MPSTRSLNFWLFGPNWYGLDAPRHVISYCPKALRFLCDTTGLEIVKICFQSGAFNFVRSVKHFLEEKGKHWPGWLHRIDWPRNKLIRRTLKPFFFLIDIFRFGDVMEATLKKRATTDGKTRVSDEIYTIQEVQKITDKVDGWLGKREGPYLYSLAKIGSTKGVIVEIGSWKGKSTIWLAKGCEAVHGEKVYTIDPHGGGADLEKIGIQNIHTEEEFRKNMRMAKVEALVVPLVKTSMEAVKGWSLPIGLLWIDGDHSYESVRNDFFSWEPHVVEGGIIALHDTYSWEGVRKVVDEELVRINNFEILGQVSEILAIKKVRSLSLLSRAKNKAMVYLRQINNKAKNERRHWRALPRKLLRRLSTPKFGS